MVHFDSFKLIGEYLKVFNDLILKTLNSTDSVLRCALKPETLQRWRSENQNFGEKGQFRYGSKLLKNFRVQILFIKNKKKSAVFLKSTGTIPDSRQRLIIVRILGPMVSNTSLMRQEGTFSRGQVVGFE